jgi:hypothetical protein
MSRSENFRVFCEAVGVLHKNDKAVGESLKNLRSVLGEGVLLDECIETLSERQKTFVCVKLQLALEAKSRPESVANSSPACVADFAEFVRVSHEKNLLLLRYMEKYHAKSTVAHEVAA